MAPSSQELEPPENPVRFTLANKLARIAWSVLRHDKAFDAHLEIAAI
jgi:hypothetical protein